MAETKSLEQILGKTINSTKELRDEIKRLQDQLVTADKDSSTWTETTQKLVAAQERLTDVTKAGKQQIDAAEDSIVGMEKQYKAMYNAYKLLSEEQRNSDFGKNMANSLNELSNKLNSTKKDVGNFKDNIGRYSESAVEAFNAMGISIGGLQTPLKLANGGFKALNATLLANPIMWIVAALVALVAIFKKVKDAINANEESQMALNESMALFQPVIDAVSNAFDWLGQQVVKVINFYAELFAKIREVIGAVTDFLGITDGANKRIKEQNALYKELAVRTNELTKAKREALKLNAAQDAEVKTLMDQAAATADNTEKLKLLEEAKRIQQEITDRNIKMAEEEFDIMRTKATLTANDAKTNDELAAAEARVNEARAQGAAATRRMSSQITNLTKAQKGGKTAADEMAEALKKEKEEMENLVEELEEYQKTDLQKLTEKYEKQKALLEKYGKDTTALTERYEKEKGEIELEQWKQRMNNKQRLTIEATSGDLEKMMEELKFMETTFGNAYNDYARNLQILKDNAAEMTPEDVQKLWLSFGTLWDEVTESETDALLVLARMRNEIEALKNNIADTEIEGRLSGFITEYDLNILKQTKEIWADQEKSEQERYFKISQLGWDYLDQYKTRLEEELSLTQMSTDMKLKLEMEYYATIDAIRQRDTQAAILAADLKTGVWVDSLDAVLGLNDAVEEGIGVWSSLIEAQLEEGEITEEQSKKKQKTLKALQAVQLAVGLASVVADTAAGIMSIWRGYAVEKIANAETAAATGPAAAVTLAALNAKSLASAIIGTTGLGIMAASQIAALTGGYISNVKSIGGGEGGGEATAVAPQQIDTTAYTYTRQLQTEEEEENLNRPIWVSVEDISSGLNSVQVREENSTF